jgi:hypothetical protein
MAVAFAPLDIFALLVILGGVFGIGIWISWRGRHQSESSDFFLGGRDMAWWAVAGSLFASNIGCARGRKFGSRARPRPLVLAEQCARAFRVSACPL